MRVKIEEDEWYPVYSITERDYCRIEGELTAKEVRQIKAAFAAFDNAQQLLTTAMCRVTGHGKWRTIRYERDGTAVEPYEACGLCDARRDGEPPSTSP